jgi:hypothetical protein
MRRISWKVPIKYKEILNTIKEDGNVLHKMKGRNSEWILPKHVIDERIKGTGRQG